MIQKKNKIQVSLNTHNWKDKIEETISNRDFKKLKFEIMINDIWIDEIYIHSLFVGNRLIIDMMNEFGFEVNKQIDFQTISKLLTDYDVLTFKLLMNEGYELTPEMKIQILNYLENEYVYYFQEFNDYFTHDYMTDSRIMKIKRVKEKIKFKQ